MPWEVRKVPGGYKVYKVGTRKAYSKNPLSQEDAKAQMRALYASEKKMDEKLPQDEVDYRLATNPAMTCGRCSNFQPPASCSVVQGPISPMDVCNDFYPA